MRAMRLSRRCETRRQDTRRHHHRTAPSHQSHIGNEEQRTFHDARRIAPSSTGFAADNYGRTSGSAMHRRRPSAMRDAAAPD